MLVINDKTIFKLPTQFEKNQILVRKFSDNESSSDDLDDGTEIDFATEIAETIKKGIINPIDIDNVIIEVNSLRLSENKTFVECL